jgi:hypothetical protein
MLDEERCARLERAGARFHRAVVEKAAATEELHNAVVAAGTDCTDAETAAIAQVAALDVLALRSRRR